MKSTKAQSLVKRLVGGKLSEMATYSDLFQKTNDAIFLLDLDNSQVLECNPAAAKLLDTPDLEGQDFLAWATPDSREILKKHFQSLQKADAQETSFDLSFLNRKKEEIILELSSGRLKLADYCEVIQIIAKDVTAERHATRALLAANEKLAILSTTDEMTKLFNFRYFKAELEKEHTRSLRHKKPYAIILCDIDHFKNFNDKNGHLEGDEALRRAAAILQSRSRQTDIVARYGGEEFVVLCPEVDGQQAQVLAEALRKNIANENFPHGEKQPLGRVTISIGVASFPADSREPDELLRLADQALYEAKAGGRNQVRAILKKAA